MKLQEKPYEHDKKEITLSHLTDPHHEKKISSKTDFKLFL